MSSDNDMTRLNRPLLRRVLGYDFEADLSLIALAASAVMISAGIREPKTRLALWPFLAATVALIYYNIRSGIFVNDQMVRFRGLGNRRFLWKDIKRIEYASGRAHLILESGERYLMPGSSQFRFGSTGDLYSQWKPAQRTVSVVIAAAPQKISICFAGSDSEPPPAGVARCVG